MVKKTGIRTQEVTFTPEQKLRFHTPTFAGEFNGTPEEFIKSFDGRVVIKEEFTNMDDKTVFLVRLIPHYIDIEDVLNPVGLIPFETSQMRFCGVYPIHTIEEGEGVTTVTTGSNGYDY